MLGQHWCLYFIHMTNSTVKYVPRCDFQHYCLHTYNHLSPCFLTGVINFLTRKFFAPPKMFVYVLVNKQALYLPFSVLARLYILEQTVDVYANGNAFMLHPVPNTVPWKQSHIHHDTVPTSQHPFAEATGDLQMENRRGTQVCRNMHKLIHLQQLLAHVTPKTLL